MEKRTSRALIFFLLLSSAAAFLVAPFAIAPSYSWVRYSISESAAQGLVGAWVARLGFLLFGFGVLWLSLLAVHQWGKGGTLALGTFGVMMLGSAAFSHRPWIAGTPFDSVEDFLHSATATIMGMAFVAGVILVGIQRKNPSKIRRTLDTIAVLSSVVIPLAMSQDTGYTGLLQRGMFIVAYVWYSRETLAQGD